MNNMEKTAAELFQELIDLSEERRQWFRHELRTAILNDCDDADVEYYASRLTHWNREVTKAKANLAEAGLTEQTLKSLKQERSA